VSPPQRQREARLKRWFGATEQYKRQLHELDRDDYLAIKRAEISRSQQAR
jgi:hypothetical protein